MFIDSRTLPSGTIIEADICIIGAGAAGITLACELAHGGLTVAVFESGGFEYDQTTQQLYEGPLLGQPTTPIGADRLRYLGGSTNHWSGGCRPFDAHDFAAWPFGSSELDPYYRRAQALCQLGPFTYDPADWTTATSYPIRFAPGARLTTGMYQYSPPTRFGEVYRNALATLTGLKTYLHANVVDIALADDASQVSGLKLMCLDGKQFRARGRFYVLAAGALENARLLLTSDRVMPAGIGNVYDKVGRYFMDHPYISCVATVVWFGPKGPLAFYDYDDEGNVRDNVRVQAYLMATPETLASEKMPAFGIGIQPNDIPDRGFWLKSAKDIYHAIAAGQMPQDLAFHIATIARGLEWESERDFQRILHLRPSIYSTAYIAECPPDPESRVKLIDERDALGMRRIALDWRLPPDFEHNMRRAHAILAAELGRAGLGRLRMHSAETGYDPMTAIGNGHHHMGTTRMDRDPRLGVVNEDCRVHACANLYVAGSSVFPSYSFDNPTLTLVALALRLSEHLKRELAPPTYSSVSWPGRDRIPTAAKVVQ